MAGFSRFYKREELISKTLDIDEELYEKLEYLSKNVYDASITKLVNAAIEELIESENVKLYERKNKYCVSRSFLIRKPLLDGLYKLKDKYRVPMYLLVNIAVKNEIEEISK